MRIFYSAGSGARIVDIAGEWLMKVGADLAEVGSPPVGQRKVDQNSPAVLFNAMIHPLLPLPIKGAIWYQGESNNGEADRYAMLFRDMIRDWRDRWGLGDFPFLFVQIAPHHDMRPELRNAQRRTLKMSPNAAMVVITDHGDAKDIHPPNKEPVGERLALAARARAYGEDIVYSSPLAEEIEVRGARAIVYFSHAGSGLVVHGSELRGFEIAGPDGEFKPATATIDRNTVVVTGDGVDNPVHVRFGWSNVPDGNLFNSEGLPASPFIVSLDNSDS